LPKCQQRKCFVSDSIKQKSAFMFGSCSNLIWKQKYWKSCSIFFQVLNNTRCDMLVSSQSSTVQLGHTILGGGKINLKIQDSQLLDPWDCEQ
ncbi:hypothetical protein L9F63_019042, partial [Diploptera punctata]